MNGPSPDNPASKILIEAASQVGPALFFSLLIITVSFMPIFTLEAQEGRLFSPLAFTKTFAMAAAAILSVTLVPALMVVFVRGKIIPEHRNPINRFLIWIYRPVIKAVMRAKILVILIALAVLAVTIWPARQLGTEFMPNLNEGTLLYMPTTLPGHFRHQGRRVAADAGPDHQELSRSGVGLRQGRPRGDRDRSGADRNVRDHHQSETEGRMAAGLTLESLTAEMDKALQFPGVSNAWTHADQGPHRHALDRHPHADRRQGDRHRSGRDRPAGKTDRAGAADGARARRRPMPSAASAAIISTSFPTARRWRVTAS